LSAGFGDKTIYFKIRNADGESGMKSDTIDFRLNPADATIDGDGDGLFNKEEYEYGTDATKQDTDGDHLNDYDEIFVTHSNPLNIDTDDDGLTDDVDFYPTNPNHYRSSKNYISYQGGFNGGGDHRTSEQFVAQDRISSLMENRLIGNAVTLVCSVSPSNQDVAKEAGTTTFAVANTGAGTMAWTAAENPDVPWLTITSGASGSNAGTITCTLAANTSTSPRTGMIRVTATGANGSPVDGTVTQAGSPALSLMPSNQPVAKEACTTTFSVSNTGAGTMPWTAAENPDVAWLSITSGASGTNAGTITCTLTANTSTSPRTGTIRVTATGATGSPMDVTVTQAGSPAPKLADVIKGLQILAGMDVDISHSVADANGDGRVEMSDVLANLLKISGLK
jgi:hypothetical protein